MTMESIIKPFSELSAKELHDIYQLRIAVFVVEQTCYYQDVDGLDLHPETRHAMFWDGGPSDGGTLVGYARILAPGTSYLEYSSMGRIVNAQTHRNMGLGHKIVERSVITALEYWPVKSIKISAQAHLQGFYGKHQFVTVTDEYLEDGIPHVGMVRKTIGSE